MSVRRNTAYNIAGLTVPVFLSLVTVPVYLRLVGPELYGVLAMAWLLLGYFGLFDLGLNRTTSYRIGALRDASPEARSDTFWAALGINAVMGVVGGLLLLAVGHYFFAHAARVDEALRPEILASVPLLACAVPISTLTGALLGALEGREKFFETNLISLLTTALFQLLPIGVAFWIGPNLFLLLAAAILARLIAILALGLRCYTEFCRGRPRRFVRSEVMLLLKYGGWVNLSSLCGQAIVVADRFMIGAVLGAAAVTIYAVPLQLAQRIQILPGALIKTLFPRLSASEGEAGGLVDMASRTLLALLTLPVMVAIYLIEPFLRLWVGDAIGAQSAPVGRIVLVGYWIHSFAMLSLIRLQTAGRPDLVTKYLFVQLPIYMGALYLALRSAGFVGCAAVFALKCAADYVVLTWLANRTLSNWRGMLSSFVLLSLAAYCAGRWPIDDWRCWTSAAGVGSVLLLGGWLALPEEVKVTLKSSRPGRALARALGKAP